MEPHEKRQIDAFLAGHIGLYDTTIVAIDGTRVTVDHLEALDGTPVLDVKPALDAPARR